MEDDKEIERKLKQITDNGVLQKGNFEYVRIMIMVKMNNREF